jgi:hypothetical protein
MTGIEVALAVTAVAGTLVQVAGAVQQAGAAKEQGRINQQIAERNAQISEEEARLAEKSAAFDEDRLREQGIRRRAAARAAAGAQGRSLEGSPLLLLAEDAADTEIDALSIRFGGARQAAALRSQAEVERLGGQAAGIKARNQATAAKFKAGSSVLTGARGVIESGVFD